MKSFINLFKHRTEINTAIKELNAMTNRELADIGITRSEIRQAVHQ